MHTSFEKALIIAKENGYATEGNNQSEILNDKYKILLDKEFFIALGRGLGWGDENGIDHRTFWNGTIEYPEISDEGVGYREVWRYKMHLFTDHLIEGKDIESFFEQLIN